MHEHKAQRVIRNFGQDVGNSTEIVTKSAQEVTKAKFDNTSRPLAFAGIENQYFTIFVKPEGEHRESETVATVIQSRPDAPQKADVSFEILSKPVAVGPNHPVSQSYTIYAGPKAQEALAPYGAEGLVAYRKSWFEEIGYSAGNFPETLEEYREAGKRLKAIGRPLGQTLGHTFGDAPSACISAR